DAVSIVVGIVIGAGIFRTAPDVFKNVPDALTGLLSWVLGAVLAVVGSLCYAELAGAYPSDSGESEFLTRAFGPAAGFAFAWAQLTVIRTSASIAAIAYVCGEYAQSLMNDQPGVRPIVTTAAITGLTIVNAFGLEPGRRTQNLLTCAKLLGLFGVVLAGLV